MIISFLPTDSQDFLEIKWDGNYKNALWNLKYYLIVLTIFNCPLDIFIECIPSTN